MNTLLHMFPRPTLKDGSNRLRAYPKLSRKSSATDTFGMQLADTAHPLFGQFRQIRSFTLRHTIGVFSKPVQVAARPTSFRPHIIHILLMCAEREVGGVTTWRIITDFMDNKHPDGYRTTSKLPRSTMGTLLSALLPVLMHNPKRSVVRMVPYTLPLPTGIRRTYINLRPKLLRVKAFWCGLIMPANETPRRTHNIAPFGVSVWGNGRRQTTPALTEFGRIERQLNRGMLYSSHISSFLTQRAGHAGTADNSARYLYASIIAQQAERTA